MHDRDMYLLHTVAWKQIKYADWCTERRATHSAERDHCIITSSGRRWWVSKAVSCHRNPQRTLQRKQHRRLWRVIPTRPLSATSIPHTQHSEADGDVWCEDSWTGGKNSTSSPMLADEMCQKDENQIEPCWPVLVCRVMLQAYIRSEWLQGTFPKTGYIINQWKHLDVDLNPKSRFSHSVYRSFLSSSIVLYIIILTLFLPILLMTAADWFITSKVQKDEESWPCSLKIYVLKTY